jgi:hypothetical protein
MPGGGGDFEPSSLFGGTTGPLERGDSGSGPSNLPASDDVGATDDLERGERTTRAAAPRGMGTGDATLDVPAADSRGLELSVDPSGCSELAPSPVTGDTRCTAGDIGWRGTGFGDGEIFTVSSATIDPAPRAFGIGVETGDEPFGKTPTVSSATIDPFGRGLGTGCG